MVNPRPWRLVGLTAMSVYRTIEKREKIKRRYNIILPLLIYMLPTFTPHDIIAICMFFHLVSAITRTPQRATKPSRVISYTAGDLGETSKFPPSNHKPFTKCCSTI